MQQINAIVDWDMSTISGIFLLYTFAIIRLVAFSCAPVYSQLCVDK